jgi:hypothetical protein
MFQVRWEDSALNELAEIWTHADSTLRETITVVTHQIDLQLQNEPLGASESAQADDTFISPLPWASRSASKRTT